MAVQSKINEFTHHLEYLGYSVQTLEPKEPKSPKVYLATHAQKWNLLLWEANPDLVMFQVTIQSSKKAAKGMDECVNLANQKLLLAKAYHFPAGKTTALKLEAYYPGGYERRVFGAFLDAFLNDVREFSALDTKKLFF